MKKLFSIAFFLTAIGIFGTSFADSTSISSAVALTVIDSTTSKAMAGVAVIIDDGAIKTTDSQGKIFASVAQGRHIFAVSKTGYVSVSQTINVTGNTTVSVVIGMLKVDAPSPSVKGEISVTVLDLSKDKAMAGAAVIFDSVTVKMTDGQGKASASVAQGRHSVVASKIGYVSVSLPVNVAGNTVTPVTIALKLTTTVIGSVLANGVPVVNAHVTLVNSNVKIDSTHTDSIGFYSFTIIKKSESHEKVAATTGYSVEIVADGYAKVNLPVTPVTDRIVTVNVNIANTTTVKIQNQAPSKSFTVSLQRDNILTITTAGLGGMLQLMTLSGKKVFSARLGESKTNYAIPGNRAHGVLIAKVISGNEVHMTPIMFSR